MVVIGDQGALGVIRIQVEAGRIVAAHKRDIGGVRAVADRQGAASARAIVGKAQYRTRRLDVAQIDLVVGGKTRDGAGKAGRTVQFQRARVVGGEGDIGRCSAAELDGSRGIGARRCASSIAATVAPPNGGVPVSI